MGPIVPGAPGAPGFPAGPAGPGRLQTSWEEWMVSMQIFLDDEFVDCETTTDSVQRICSVMVTVEKK